MASFLKVLCSTDTQKLYKQNGQQSWSYHIYRKSFFSVFHSIIFSEVESIYCALYKMYKRVGIKSNWFFFWPLMNLVKI